MSVQRQSANISKSIQINESQLQLGISSIASVPEAY